MSILCHTLAALVAICGALLLPNMSTSPEKYSINTNFSTLKLVVGRNLTSSYNGFDIVSDLLNNIVPNNIVRAFFSLQATAFINKKSIKSGDIISNIHIWIIFWIKTLL